MTSSCGRSGGEGWTSEKQARDGRFEKMRARAGRDSMWMCTSVKLASCRLVWRVANADRPADVMPGRRTRDSFFRDGSSCSDESLKAPRGRLERYRFWRAGRCISVSVSKVSGTSAAPTLQCTVSVVR